MDRLAKFSNKGRVELVAVQAIGSASRARSVDGLDELANNGVHFSNNDAHLSDNGTVPVCNDDTVDPVAGPALRVASRIEFPRPAFAIRRRRRLPTGRQWAWVGALALGVACATVPRGASEANLARAQSGAADGSALFKERCAGCHGERGEGVGNAPRVLGQGALPEYPRERNLNADPAAGDPELLRLKAQMRPAGAPWRDPFRTAQDLYAYMSKHMPLPVQIAGSLSAEQYWAIVNFMALAHGLDVPPAGINAGNAGSVKLQVGRP